MTDRRFNEAEVEAIFDIASTSSENNAQSRVPSSDGMTLAQLQDIGRQVGIAPGEIARAALAVDGGTKRPTRTFLGLPLGVERTVPLARQMSDDEWDRVVVDLRQTFDASGTVRREGSLRQWSNGNLHAALEPTATGYRLRLRTLKSGARERMVVGGVMFLLASVGLVASALTGSLDDIGRLVALAFMGTAGAVMSAGTAMRLRSWARLRQEQIDDLAVRFGPTSPPPRALRDESEDQ